MDTPKEIALELEIDEELLELEIDEELLELEIDEELLELEIDEELLELEIDEELLELEIDEEDLFEFKQPWLLFMHAVMSFDNAARQAARPGADKSQNLPAHTCRKAPWSPPILFASSHIGVLCTGSGIFIQSSQSVSV